MGVMAGANTAGFDRDVATRELNSELPEGTVAKYSLKHRLFCQTTIEHALKRKVKDIDINFTLRADAGH